MVERAGIDTARGMLVTVRNFDDLIERGARARVPGDRQAEPRGLEQGHLQRRASARRSSASPRSCRRALKSALRTYPDGVLVEEYIEGADIALGFIEGVGHDDGLLTPVEMLFEPEHGKRGGERQFNIYDYRLKNVEPGKVQYRCPANIPRDVAARLRSISMEVDPRARPARHGAPRLPRHAGGPDLPARGQRPARARVAQLAVRGHRAGRPDLQRDDRRDPQRRRAALRSRDRSAARRSVLAARARSSRSASASPTT